jgi:hypothetical protein
VKKYVSKHPIRFLLTLLTLPDGPQQPAADWTVNHPGIADPEPGKVRADLATLMGYTSHTLGTDLRVYSRNDPRAHVTSQFGLSPAQQAERARLEQFVHYAQQAIQDLDGFLRSGER